MMGFLRPLTDAERLAKEQRDLAKFKADAGAKQVADAEASKKAAATKRPQGRPRKLVPDYTVQLAPKAVALKKAAKRLHRNWWHPHLMRMILRAVITQDGYLPAVKHLQLHQPVLFRGLEESFVRKNYQPGSLKKLTPKAVEKLDRGCGNVGSAGRRPMLVNHPEAQQEIRA